MPTDAKPLIMCTRSVIAWQANAKTQTRRLVRPQPPEGLRIVQIAWGWLAVPEAPHSYRLRQPYAVGDLLWIREALVRGNQYMVLYEADQTIPANWDGRDWNWKRDKLPAMFMPRWSCRYYARVISVCPERLQEITDKNAIAEGTLVYVHISDELAQMHGTETPREHYANWWNELHRKPEHQWEASPWVWVYGLEPVDNC